MANVDNLNFKVILDDKDFNTRVEKDIEKAKELNVQLSQLLQAKVKVNAISATEAASAKRASDILTKQATNQEKVSQAKAKTAEAEEKLATQAAKTAKEMERGKAAASQTAVNVQRLATEQQRTTAATQNAAAATSRAALAQRRLRDYASQTTNTIRTQNRLMSELKGYALGYLSIHGATQLISSLVRVTGEFELQKTTLAAMLGDLNEAEQIITRIQGLAVESPFQFKELTTYAKQLSAFSVPAEELYETTKMLADVSAGLGVGMDRIVLAYGQVRSAAFLRGQEVRQFTEAGIPILDELAKQFTELEGRAVSTGEVFDKISARLVPFEMVAKVFKDMTSEGGKFYNMQEVQAETLRGKISNLKDAYEIMLNEIGSQKSGAMKGAVDSLRSLMQNWERVGAILKTVIISYGVYKATLASVWAYEKLMAGVEMYKRWQRMNQLLVATTGNTRRLAAAMRVLGASSKGAVGVALAAIAALVTIIVRAISNASKLRKELESIMTSEVAGSDKAVDDLNRLVDNLKKATQGSQEYRDIISELNRKYEDYLPKIFSEADAYDQVKVAADAAAEAIRNKAKASAFDKGSAAIEKEYGTSLTELSKGLENVLLFIDPSITKKAAIEFVKRFRDEVTIGDGSEGFYEMFERVYSEFFKADNLSGLLEAANGKIEGYSDRVKSLAERYGEIIEAMAAKQRSLDEELELRFGVSEYDSFEEMRRMLEIDKWYKDQIDSLNKLTISQEEFNKEVKKLDVQKLKKQIHVYDLLRREDEANDLRDQLEALTKIPEGWRGKVQSVLKEMGLTKNSSFGLWAEDTTQSTTYVDEMVKRYKELAEQIKMVSPFDEEQTKRLQQNKDAIEAVSKALGINIKELAASKSEKFESKEEKRIKRLIDTLRELQDQYEKLKAVGASDESIKTLFEGLYPELIAENGKDFVTDLKYIERAVELVADLEKIAPEDAKKMLVDLGADEFTILVNKLEKQNKAYKDTAKAAEDYFNTLRKWSAEDFNIGGEGITFDLSKIMSDLREKTKEIDLKAQKTREMLSQIDLDSEEEIANVKAVFEKEFGAGAWEEFWNDYYVNGFDAIQSLADKQKEYEKKLAQERVNDLAEKYVKESYFTQGIEISDLGDKTLLQVRRIKKQLQDLMSEEPLKIPVEVENLLRTQGVDISNLKGVYLDEIYETLAEMGQPIDEATQSILNLIQRIQEAGLSTENFGEIIQKVFEGDLEDLTEEEGKLLSEMVEDYLGEMQSLFEAIGDFAEKIGNSKLQGAMNGIAQSMQILGNVADKLAKGDWIGAIISGVTSLAKVILDAVAAQEELNRAIEETRNEMMLLASQKAINEGVESIFGTDDYKKFTNAYDEAVKAHKQALEDIEKQNQEFTGRSKDNWGLGGILGAAAAGAATGAGIGALAGGWFGGITIAAGAIIGGITGLITGITGAAATAMNDYAITLQQMADEIGGDLINEQTGGFNSETLEKIKETYSDLDAESQEMLDKLIANAKLYENAITEVATYMTDIFGQCADDMADAFIDSFKKSGEAALDYGDIMDSVATSIAKSMIKSAIIQNVWNDDMSKEAAAMLASGDVAGAMARFEEAMKNAQDLAPYFQELLQGIEPYLEMEGAGTTDMGEGIKGITEDTASLLASYINAMRADLSMMRGMQAKYLPAIGESVPTIMDYLAQIQANTYNTAMSNASLLDETRAILGELRSVITTDSGDTAIRVYS